MFCTRQVLLQVVSTTLFFGVLQAQAPPTVEQILKSHGVSDSTPALRDALKSPDAEVRSLAAGTLALRKDTASIPLIQEALKNERSPYIKVNLAAALASLNDWQGHHSLIETCDDKTIEPSVRLEAANRILSLGGNDCTSAVADILENKPDPSSRALGLQYLHGIANIPILLMPKLQAATIETLKDPAPINRQYSGDFLAVFGDKDSVRELENAAINEKDSITRQHMEESLRRAKTRFP